MVWGRRFVELVAGVTCTIRCRRHLEKLLDLLHQQLMLVVLAVAGGDVVVLPA